MPKMTEEEAIKVIMEGYDTLFRFGVIISALPLEDWIASFERAETTMPILDPTLYRNYLYSDKAKIVKDVINAALPLKLAILKAREKVLANPNQYTKDFIPLDAEMMTIEDFILQCKIGAFTDDDGSGYYANPPILDHQDRALPSELIAGKVKEGYTHIAWFNK